MHASTLAGAGSPLETDAVTRKRLHVINHGNEPEFGQKSIEFSLECGSRTVSAKALYQ
jgi:hypothetical protein